jgi:hypothetical protein
LIDLQKVASAKTASSDAFRKCSISVIINLPEHFGLHAQMQIVCRVKKVSFLDLFILGFSANTPVGSVANSYISIH